MAVNLHSKYSAKIEQAYKNQSLIAGRLSNDYEFSGVKTVRVTTLKTVPMNDYIRNGANRYGTPTEMEDTVQELTMTQDKSFSLVVDKGNNADQNGIKSAGKAMALQLSERAIPTSDAYIFKRLVNLAGNIASNGNKLTKATICEKISDGTAALDDAEVPQDNRTLFISNANYKLLKLSDEFMGNETLGLKALAKNQVGTYDNMAVIKVPKGRWVENCNFLIVHKSAATAPFKIDETKLHEDPPGISGNLLEGRQYYDCFIFEAKCGGIYAEIDTSSGGGTVLAKPAINAATGEITATSGAAVKFTVDGSDPRYSSTAAIGTNAGTGAEKTVKAYAFKEGAFSSAVAEAKLTA